jgi:RNA-directed DNA polymerase
MKRLAITLQDIAERSNLLLAVHKAAHGKQHRPAVAQFVAALDANLNHLAQSILQGTAPQGQSHSFVINDPKRRTITAACFADRVLHHAILNLAEPRFEAMLVPSTYACRPGKGVHQAVRAVQRNLQRFAWVVQVDVAGYFPSICHARLNALLATRFKGEEFLALLARVVATGNCIGNGSGSDKGNDSPGVGAGTRTGLPIGALTSQHYANAYLDVADRFLLAHTGVRAHVRYMDDMLWFCDSRADAVQTLAELTAFLWEQRGLRLKAGAHAGLQGAARRGAGQQPQALALPPAHGSHPFGLRGGRV